MSYNVKRKSGLSKFLTFLFIVFIIVFVVFLVRVVFSSAPAAPVADVGTDASADADPAVIDEFVAGTYGGIKMDTAEDAVNYYIKAYDATKAKTSSYSTPNGTQTWYQFIGEEDLSVGDVLIEGKSNSMINNLVPGIVGGLFQPGAYGLPPCTNRSPKDDVDEKGASFGTMRAVADDFVAVSVKDNGDGTITMSLQPKASQMSHRGMDSQGKFFNTLGAIDETVNSISVLSWSEGTTAENCIVSYKGGFATVTIDTKSGEITSADYDMEVLVDVSHACVTVIKDKKASVVVSYKMHFPASDQYLKEKVEATRA